MYRYHFRLRVILLSLGVLFGFGSGIAHLAGYHGYRGHHGHGAHDCMDHGWSWDHAPWQSNDAPAQNSAPAPKPVQ